MSFFRYPGGKSKLRNEISRRLSARAQDGNLQYREPFFGGGSIGLKFLSENPRSTRIWINDKDIGIASLWTSVIRYPLYLTERVKIFKPSVQAFHEFREELTSLSVPLDNAQIVDIGFKKLAIHQISYSGLGTKSGGPLGGEKQKSEYKIDCRWSPDYICNKISKLTKQFCGLIIHGGMCTSYDFSELLGNTNNRSLLYLDPPYYLKGNDLYQCGFTQQDHERLATLLKATNHQWVLSYDDCPEIRELYKWAYIEPLDVNYSITALKHKKTGKRLSRTKGELLISAEKVDEPLFNQNS